MLPHLSPFIKLAVRKVSGNFFIHVQNEMFALDGEFQKWGYVAFSCHMKETVEKIRAVVPTILRKPSLKPTLATAIVNEFSHFCGLWEVNIVSGSLFL